MVSQQELKDRLCYDQETGIFTRKLRVVNSAGDKVYNSRYAGKVAGSTLLCGHSGRSYRRIYLDGKVYLSHNLAWLYINGSFPSSDELVIHIDGDSLNNIYSNLKIIKKKDHPQYKKIRSNNTSNFEGVTYHKAKGKWVAFISYDKEKYHLGFFDLFKDAVKARLDAEDRFYGEK